MGKISKIVFNEKTGVNEEYRYIVMTGYKVSYRNQYGTPCEAVFAHEPTDEEIGDLILTSNANIAYIQEFKYLKDDDELSFN